MSTLPIPIRRVPFTTAETGGAPPIANPLPHLLHTPSGLAILELQGSINLPEHAAHDSSAEHGERQGKGYIRETAIGRLVFPDYDHAAGKGDTDWMKRVYLYVGKHQRLTGEVKKLPKALAVLRKAGKKGGSESGQREVEEQGNFDGEELEIVEIVKWKILFSQRPEPVGTWQGEAS